MASKRKTSNLTLPLKVFKAAFLTAARATPSRTPAPVLLSVKLTVAEGTATFEATNFEVRILHRVPCDPRVDSFTILLPHDTVTSLLKVASGDDVSLSIDGLKVGIKVGSRTWNVSTADPEHYPSQQLVEMPNHHEVDATWLGTAIKRTLKESRVGAMEGFSTSSVQFDPLMTALGVTTFNGRSLAHQEIPASPVGSPTSLSPLPMIPDSTARLLQGLLSGTTEPVKVGFPTANHGLFVIGDTTLICRLSEGKFWDWRSFLAKFPAPQGSMVVPCKSFRSALACAAVALDTESRTVEVVFETGPFHETDKGRMTLESSSERGDSLVVEEVDWEGESVEVSIDPQYVENMLAAIGDETPLSVSVFENRRIPMKLKTEDGFLGLVQYIVRN